DTPPLRPSVTHLCSALTTLRCHHAMPIATITSTPIPVDTRGTTCVQVGHAGSNAASTPSGIHPPVTSHAAAAASAATMAPTSTTPPYDQRATAVVVRWASPWPRNFPSAELHV